MVAVESGGNFLVECGVWQKIAGKLLDGKLIEGKVSVVGTDHPVTPGPHVTVGIILVTIGIGIPRGIEPVTCHVFTITRRCKKTINDFRVGIRRIIGKEGIQFSQRRRQPCQVKGDTAQKCRLVGFRRWL